MNKSLNLFRLMATLVVLLVNLSAAMAESFTGAAARSGTFKRPLLDVNGTRYELQAADSADKTVEELLKMFSEGDTGKNVVEGTRATVKGKDGIVIKSVAPATAPEPRSAATPTPTKPVPTTPAPKSAPATATSTSPQVAVSVVTVGDDRYTVYDYDDLIARRCSFVIPEGLKAVRGLLVHGCYSGGDSRYDWKDCEYYRQFMHLHGFAYVGNTFAAGPLFGKTPPPADTSAMARHRAIYDSFVDSVKSVAAASQHPEMVNAPYAGVGFSAGGGNALNLMCFAPEKTIAAASYCAPYLFKRRITGPASPQHLGVPAIAITGELEKFNAPLPADVDPATGPARIDEVFLPYRSKGATYAWMERQGRGHSYFENRQDVLGIPFLDAAVRARYPTDGDVTKGPIKLIDIDHADGWIADNTSWKSGLTKIVPAKDFKGDLGHSSWLQNEDLAFIYRAYSTYDNPLTITSPGDCWPTMPALEPGSSVPITVDASQFGDWKTIAFYDGAKKLGEVTTGSPTRLTATDLKPGYHVFSILATDGDGNVRTADPKLVIVKPAKVASIGETSETSATQTASEVTVVTTFPAGRGPGYKMVPDTQGAVGRNHVVDFDGLNFVVHDKQTGAVLVKKSQREFWASVEPADTLIAPNPWDPRFLYDTTSDRWIGIIASDGHGLGYLAVSTSSDPTKPWKGVILPMEKQDLGFKLGVDKNGLYATYASADPGRDIHTIHDCIAIPKDDLLAPEGPSLANLVTFTRLEHDSFPATDLTPDKAPGDPEVILNKEFGDDCTRLYMYKITWQGKTASISEKQVIPLNKKYRSPNTTVQAATAPQPAPGLTIRAPRRTIAVAQFGDSVYQCNNAKRNDESRWGILWCQVRVSDGKLLQEGLIDDPDCDYLIPSLAVDKDGNVGIGCTRTSATEFPSVYVTMHAAGDPEGTARKPVLAVSGTTYYRVTNPHRFGAQFGNYSSTCIDPTNSGVFWTCQEYADSTTPDQWCTVWAAFQLESEGDSVSTEPRVESTRNCVADTADEFPDAKTDWHGFDRFDFLMDATDLSITPIKAAPDEGTGAHHQVEGQLRCITVAPKQAAEGKPWSWRGRYFDHEPQVEIELLRRGFHIGFVQSDDIKHWEAWFTYLTEKHGLSGQPAFVGMSGGGRNAFTWATTYPDRVSCIYADNPLITRESLMKLDELVRRDVPLLHICGSLDPLSVNHTFPIENIYQQLGGRISVMIKDGVGHHPHSLRDPTLIAGFITESLKPASQVPAFVSREFTRSSFYGIENRYKEFPAEDMHITCRGSLFSDTFDCYEFKPDCTSGNVHVIVPRTVAPGKPWVMRADPALRDAVVDLALLEKGFHIVRAPRPRDPSVTQMQEWQAFYDYLVGQGFSSKPVLEGAGGAAGEIYEWAIAHPKKVSCIYGKNPILRHYSSQSQPIDNLAPLAKAGVPILHICGSNDPWLDSQTVVAEKRLRGLGGKITVMIQNGASHDPLTPENIGPAVEFVMQSVAANGR